MTSLQANTMKLVRVLCLKMVYSSSRSISLWPDCSKRHPGRLAVSIGGDVKGICCNGERYSRYKTSSSTLRITIHHELSSKNVECHLGEWKLGDNLIGFCCVILYEACGIHRRSCSTSWVVQACPVTNNNNVYNCNNNNNHNFSSIWTDKESTKIIT